MTETKPTDDHAAIALRKIRRRAHALTAGCTDERTSRGLWDIFWLAVAGLEGRQKASALDTFTALSGLPTDDPERIVEDEA